MVGYTGFSYFASIATKLTVSVRLHYKSLWKSELHNQGVSVLCHFKAVMCQRERECGYQHRGIMS